MKRFFFSTLVMTSLFISLQAFAMDLSQARASGLVGEKPDGYVAMIKPSPDVQALVNDINARRMEEYKKISNENKQPVDVVAKLAAQEILGNLPAGSLYQGTNGAWVKK